MHVLTFGAVPRYFEICLVGALSVTVISGSCWKSDDYGDFV